MNRDVVCSLWNRASPVWAVQLTASNGVEYCEIDSTLIQWHRIREIIGSEPDSEWVCSTSSGATLPINVWHQQQRVRF